MKHGAEQLEFAAQTDTGLVREHNEDSVTVNASRCFAVLADGMGGYSAGEVASDIATSVVKTALEAGLGRLPDQVGQHSHHDSLVQQLLVDAIQNANTAVLDAARVEPRYKGMGTTIVVALFHRKKIIVAHVGDSRAYRFRQGQLAQITRDHSLLQEQIDAGLISPEWARFAQHKNLVTRAVGVGADMEVEVHDYQVEPGDLYLLCSDGLSDMLSSQEISDILASNQPLDATCGALIQRANDNGGHDNISVILIRVPEHSPETGHLFGRILSWMK